MERHSLMFNHALGQAAKRFPMDPRGTCASRKPIPLLCVYLAACAHCVAGNVDSVVCETIVGERTANLLCLLFVSFEGHS